MHNNVCASSTMLQLLHWFVCISYVKALCADHLTDVTCSLLLQYHIHPPILVVGSIPSPVKPKTVKLVPIDPLNHAPFRRCPQALAVSLRRGSTFLKTEVTVFKAFIPM